VEAPASEHHARRVATRGEATGFVRSIGDYEADGAWLAKEDDAAFNVQLVTSEGRAKRYVTIYRPPGEP
jgi:hypothetical protein